MSNNMTGEGFSSSPQNTDPNPWDSLTKVPAYSETKPLEPSSKKFAKVIYDLQMDFGHRLADLKAQGTQQLSDKEFERWEDEYQNYWSNMEDRLRSEKRYTMAEQAEMEEPAVAYLNDSELYQTIEAQAGHFYDQRSDALLDAIRDKKLPDAKEDLEYVRNFRRAVMHHLDYKYIENDNEWRKDDAEYYERSRTRAHNDVIERLNGLNALAEKYHVHRFTPRDFWTSENKQQTPAMSKRMRYDRDIVEEYYAIAFDYEIKDLEKKREQERKFY